MEAETSTPEVNPAKPAKQSGIDIQKALDILAERSTADDDHDHSHSLGCHSHQAEGLRSMGQTIDLTASATTIPKENPVPNDADDEVLRTQQEERRKERVAKMQAELESMSVKELLQTVLETQQQRALTYQGYNESLNQILQSGNMTSYMSSCAHTTAAFAVLSETINAVRSVLISLDRKDLEKQLANLQRHEKEKLNLTAAYHLERIRERNENIGNVDKANKRISKLLSEGVQSLRQKIDACVEEINETIEEVRYAMIEEDEEKIE